MRDDAARKPLTAVLHGKRRELTNRSLARAPAALSAAAAAGDRAHPLRGAAALAQARAVPPQAAVRAGRGERTDVSSVRAEPSAARGRLLERTATCRARARARAARGRDARGRAARRERPALRHRLAGAARDPRPRLLPPARDARQARLRRVVHGRASGTPTTSSASSSSCCGTPTPRPSATRVCAACSSCARASRAATASPARAATSPTTTTSATSSSS